MLLRPEDALALAVQQALTDQGGDGAAGGETRVERNPRVGPLASSRKFLLDVRLHPPVANVHNADVKLR